MLIPVLSAALLLGAPAIAMSPGSGQPDAAAATQRAARPLPEGQHRPLPRYDGREPAESSAAEAALWIPRVLFAPVYLVSEYVIRWPLGALATAVERHNVPAILIDFFTFGPHKNGGIIPSFLIDFGFRPSGGLYFFYDAPDGTNQLRARVAVGGREWAKASLGHRVLLSERSDIATKVSFGIRPDYLFHGLGPSSGDQATRFSQRRLEVLLRYQHQLWRTSHFEADLGVRHAHLGGTESALGEPSVDEGAALDLFPPPPGMNGSYRVSYQRLAITLDSRQPRLIPATQPEHFALRSGSGVRMAARGEHAVSLKSRDARLPGAEQPAWLRYGGQVAGYLDLTGTHRVLGLSFTADFVDPLPYGEGLPVTEYVGSEEAGRSPAFARDACSIAARRPPRWSIAGRCGASSMGRCTSGWGTCSERTSRISIRSCSARRSASG